MKWTHTRQEIENMTAFEAKHAGDEGSANMKTLKIDWVSFEGRHFPYRAPDPGEHYRLIKEAMIAKLEQNPEVKKVLMKTGNLILIPDHKQDSKDPPEWRYYEIWMQIRKDIRDRAYKNRSRRSCS